MISLSQIVEDWLEANPREYWEIDEFQGRPFLGLFYPFENDTQLKAVFDIQNDHLTTIETQSKRTVNGSIFWNVQHILPAADPDFFKKLEDMMIRFEQAA